MTVRAFLVRGVVAGVLAGLVAGIFAFFVAEPVIDRAVDQEAQRVATEYQHALDAAILDHHGDVATATKDVAVPPPDVFSRDVQHLGLIVATMLFGLGVGGIFAVVYLIVGRRASDSAPWRRSLALATAVMTGLYLLPFLRYPANPPGVGDPSTIDRRTFLYICAIAMSAAAVWVAWRLSLSLRRRGVPEPGRHLAVAAVIAAVIVIERLVLPDFTDPVRVPADLLWDFRIRSLATSLLLWGSMAAVFGLLTESAMRRAAVSGYLGERRARLART